MGIAYTMRIPDCGSVNRQLPVAAFLDSTVFPLSLFALSPSCLCAIPTTDGTFDAAALSFPGHKNQLPHLNMEPSIIPMRDNK